MSTKKKLKIIISIVAGLAALTHILFPAISIDLITVALLAIAVVPWLETLFKSVELPGGVKLEFQELEKIAKDAKEVGLITSHNTEDLGIDTNTKPSYYFVEIAEKNQELALVSLRIEIEKRLRDIAAKYDVETKRYSVIKLIELLDSKNILTPKETEVLKNIISVLNKAAHGVEYDYRNTQWVIDNGVEIVDGLENKVASRGVIFHGSEDDREHWIDKSYRECEWVSNLEWQDCITKHLDLWNIEMGNIYTALLKKISAPQKELLIQSQEHWKEQVELDKSFMYSFEDLREKVGREGQILSYSHFMKKVRDRVLELEEILTMLAVEY
jgi:uncharacterized protein YecT (DUF1311 family)